MTCETIRENLPLIKEDSHHPSLSVVFEINISINSKFVTNTSSTTYNFKKANFTGLYNALTYVDWSFLDNVNDANCMCDLFYDKLYFIFDLYVPKYVKRKDSYPRWFSSEIIRNIKLKNKLHHQYKLRRITEIYEEFSRVRKLVKQVKDSFQQYLQKVQGDLAVNPNHFWAFVQSKKGSSRIPGRMSLRNKVYDNPHEIMEAFAEYFQSVYVQNSSNMLPSLSSQHSCVDITHLSDNVIMQSLCRLPNKLTAGEDMIPSFLIRDAAHVFVEPLSKIFNCAMSTATFPTKWKCARVCPILKTGDPGVIENYRAISILNNFAKVFEMSIYNCIYPLTAHLISDSQHGFMRNRSTVSNLTEITQEIAEVLDNKSQIDVIYTDFTKAFDKISHQRIIDKLQLFGFSERLLNFFSSYLNERLQYVSYNGFKSHSYIVTSGVPQGANLGPLLFLYFINDLSNILTCHKLLFADDLKIYSQINDITDCLIYKITSILYLIGVLKIGYS
nr:unnamed protein product [Callosobruchus analis]